MAEPPRTPAGPPPAPLPAAPRGRVLVVDDDESVRRLIRVNLELEGYVVETAGDGQEALDRVLEVAPDLVTLDVVMPRLDGFRVLERLRADPRTAALPVLMVSASTQEADARRRRAAAVDGFLPKPFDPARLVAEVHRLVAGRTS